MSSSSNKENNDNNTDEKRLGSNDYIQISSGRDLVHFGPCFELDPPKLYVHSESNDHLSEGSEVSDILQCVDNFDKNPHVEDPIDTLNYFYQLLMESIQGTTLSSEVKQQYMVYAIRVCVMSSEIHARESRTSMALADLDRCTREFKISDPELLNYLYIRYAELYMESFKYNKAFEQLKRALKLNEYLGWKLAIADTLLRMGQLFYLYTQQQEQYDDSKKILLSVLSTYDKYLNKDNFKFAEAYTQMALLNCFKEDQAYAERFFQMALEVVKDKKPSQSIDLLRIQCLNGLGIVHNVMGSHQHGITEFQQALEICNQGNHKIHQARILSNIGSVHRLLGNYSSSQVSFQKALKLYKVVLPSWHAWVKKTEHKNKNLMQSIDPQV